MPSSDQAGLEELRNRWRGISVHGPELGFARRAIWAASRGGSLRIKVDPTYVQASS